MGKIKKSSSSSKGLAAFRNSSPYPDPPAVSVTSGVCAKAPSAAAIERMLEGSRLRSELEDLADMDDEFLAEAFASGDIRLVDGEDGEVEFSVDDSDLRKFKELEEEYLKLTGSHLPEVEGKAAGCSVGVNSSSLPVVEDALNAAQGCVVGTAAAGFSAGNIANAGVVVDGNSGGLNADSVCINGGQCSDVTMVDSSVASPAVPATAGSSKPGFGGLKAGFIAHGDKGKSKAVEGSNGPVGPGGAKSFAGVGREGFVKNLVGSLGNRKPMNAGVGDKLSFIPPSGKMFKVAASNVLPIKEVWGSVLLGQYVGAPLPNFKIVDLMRSWKVPANFRYEGGWIIFQFKTDDDRDEVLRNGPYFVYNKPLIVKLVPEFFAFNRKEITTVPLWVRLEGVSKRLWTPKNLSGLASYVGVPLFMDPVTSEKKRGAYARVLVEVDLAVDIPSEVDFEVEDASGAWIKCKCFFSVENLPVFCKSCFEFGHSSDGCQVRSGRSKSSHQAAEGPTFSPVSGAEQVGNSAAWEKGSKATSYAQVVNKRGWSEWAGNKKVSVQALPGSESSKVSVVGAPGKGKMGGVPSSSNAVPAGGSEGVVAAGCSDVRGSSGGLVSAQLPCEVDESALLRARKLRLMEEGLLEDCGGETDSMCSEDYGDFTSGGDFVEELMEDICRPDLVDEEGFEMVLSKSQRKKSKANDGRDIVLGMKAKPKWPGDPCVPSSGCRPGKAGRRIP